MNIDLDREKSLESKNYCTKIWVSLLLSARRKLEIRLDLPTNC